MYDKRTIKPLTHSVGFILLGLSTNLQAYTADCVVKWNDTGEEQKFKIVVNDGKMVRYASYGTYIDYYRGMKDGYFHYNAGDGDYETYLGKFEDGQFSYSTTANNGDGLYGKCILR